MFPEWTWIVGFAIGAAIGSFLNVVIYRLPRGMRLDSPRFSFCPACRHRLGIPDLVPLLSWAILRGRCRHCGARVSGRYIAVEAITGACWGAFWYQHLVVGSDPARFLALALFSSGLIAAFFIDLRHFIIPDSINAFMLFVGLGYNAWTIRQDEPNAWTWGMPSAVAGALVGIGVIWGVALFGRLLFGKDAMGHGDIKMARGIGAVLFAGPALIGFALAVPLALLGALAHILPRLRSRVAEASAEELEPLPPESVGSLLWCGIGYVLLIDVVGLVIPRLYRWWFREDPHLVEAAEEDFPVDLTMIPFGPYLALGALAVALFGDVFERALVAYWESATGIRAGEGGNIAR